MKWVNIQCKDIYKISDNKKVCGVMQENKAEDFNKKTQFQTINRIAKKAGILTNELFKKSEVLRKKRNKIHLAGLEKADDYYIKRDVQSAFLTMSIILKTIENKLSEIKKVNIPHNTENKK